MRVPMLDMAAHQAPFAAALKQALTDVVDSGRYVLGPRVAALEEQLASRLGATHAIGVSSGTDALLVSLTALGIGPGDAVLTTPYSFIATAEAIARLGAIPRFVDIDPRTGNLHPEGVRAALESGPARAILPVHLFGQCADMDALTALAETHGVPILEDAAQAIGARCPGPGGPRSAGAIGIAGCLSFYPSKNLGGVGDGGLVLTSDDALAARIRPLRNHGAVGGHHHLILGGNFRLDELQAAALLVKLPHLEGWLRACQDHATHYDRAFADVDGIEPLGLRVPRAMHATNQYVVRVRRDRDGFRQALARRGVATAVYYPRPLHMQPAFASLGHGRGAFPEAERLAAEALALPVFPELSPEQRAHVVRTVREVARTLR